MKPVTTNEAIQTYLNSFLIPTTKENIRNEIKELKKVKISSNEKRIDLLCDVLETI